MLYFLLSMPHQNYHQRRSSSVCVPLWQDDLEKSDFDNVHHLLFKCLRLMAFLRNVRCILPLLTGWISCCAGVLQGRSAPHDCCREDQQAEPGASATGCSAQTDRGAEGCQGANALSALVRITGIIS